MIPALNAGRPWRCFCPTFCHSSFLMLSNLIRNCVDTFTFMEFLKCWTRYLFVICNTCDSGETDMKQLWNSIKQKIHFEKCILKKSTTHFRFRKNTKLTSLTVNVYIFRARARVSWKVWNEWHAITSSDHQCAYLYCLCLICCSIETLIPFFFKVAELQLILTSTKERQMMHQPLFYTKHNEVSLAFTKNGRFIDIEVIQIYATLYMNLWINGCHCRSVAAFQILKPSSCWLSSVHGRNVWFFRSAKHFLKFKGITHIDKTYIWHH